MMRKLLPLLLSPLAWADTGSPASLQQCAALAEPAARLACYDQLAAAANPVPPAAPVLAPLAAALPPPDLAAPASSAHPPLISSSQHSTLSSQWDLDEDNKLGTFVLRAHKPTYMLPAWYQASPNVRPGSPTQEPVTLFGQKMSNVEVKYQISFKGKMWENVLGTPADLWFGYTQQSHWQMYNKKQSSPFRETDYEPELMLTTPLPRHFQLGDWRMRMAGVGVLHQSNGQTDPLSRSWNRLYAMAGAENGNVSLTGRWWYRLPENKQDDDNPDLVRYMGHGDVQAIYRWNRHTLGATARYNPRSGKGALQLDWTFPVAGRLRGYVQAFDGYGESLLDYNHHSRGVGFGLMMTDWLSN
jgi:phospholipase A1